MKYYDDPTFRIFSAIFVLFIIAAIILAVRGNPISNILLIPLGAIAGIIMGLTYPFDMPFKLNFIGAIILSIVAIIVGIKYKGSIWGQFLVVFGIVAWLFCGLIGLATGT